MTRYGYVCAWAREHSVETQTAAIVAAGVSTEHLVIEEANGKLAGRPLRDTLLDGLLPGDDLVVARLAHLDSRDSHSLLSVLTQVGSHGAHLVVIEQTIDTRQPGGHAVFDLVRELIATESEVRATAVKPRGRSAGPGRPRSINADVLAQAQQRYAAGGQTVDEIAADLQVPRTTLYRHLKAPAGDCALVVYQVPRSRRSGHPDDDVRGWNIDPARRPYVRAIVYVIDGVVARVRTVDPDIAWNPDTEDGRADLGAALSAPLTAEQVAEKLPTLPADLAPGQPRTSARKNREYIPL
ncbi:recombinase family protein [Nocardia suismassiliense]|uniref:recombinase family protein n=1 Tax=Nocardia suismassiliense TaxID=2077092 RepID=UPI000D1EF084|nr:recombinase family protein [Nocardia suismassiliense]